MAVKNDPSIPPADASAIQAVTPSDVFSWPGPDVHLTGKSERTGIENNWFALTGRVVAVKVEADGDLHIALQDATGDKPGIVVAEVPAEPQWLFNVGNSPGDEAARRSVNRLNLPPRLCSFASANSPRTNSGQ